MRTSLIMVGFAVVGACSARPTSSSDDAGAASSTLTPEQAREQRRNLHALPPRIAKGLPRFAVPSPITPMADRSGRYVARARRSSTFFTDTGFAFSLGSADGAHGWGLHCALVRARNGALVAEAERGRIHERHGANSVDASTYGRLAWEEIYPGVDMVAETRGAETEYQFVLSPGAKVSDLAMRWTGAKAVRVVDDGRGVDVETGIGVLRVRGLHAYAIRGDERVELPARHVAHDSDVTIEVDGWDGRTPLLIDPTIGWSSYLGGSQKDDANAIAVDGSGNLFVVGATYSSDFPTTGGWDKSFAGNVTSPDAYITKMSSAGAVLWSSYLGGTGVDAAIGVAVDGNGSAFVTGVTSSSDFPTDNGADKVIGGSGDAFVAKFDGAGVLQWSTYFGGGMSDTGTGVAVDGSGNVFVVGNTSSNDMPTTGAAPAGYDTSWGGSTDAYVAKFGNGGAFQWASYVGGGSADSGRGVAVDGSGNAFVTGTTQSLSGIASVDGWDRSHGGGTDAYLVKVNGAGALQWATYLGGSSTEEGQDVAVDASGNAFVTGLTQSTGGFATDLAFDSSHNGSNDAFVSKFSVTGELLWLSYLGGSGSDHGEDVAVDPYGNVLVTGGTSSTNFPSTGGFDTTLGGSDAFVTKIAGDGTKMLWSSYLGGASNETGYGLAIDASGNAYVTGGTSSSDFPTTAGLDTAIGGTEDVFVTKVTGLANGATCTSAVQCLSSLCVDGVCCDKPCAGACEACTAAKKGAGNDGVCGNIVDGTDPDTECTAQSCAAGVITKPQLCNGSGACRSDGTMSCGLYACAGTACGTTCNGDAACAVNAFCSGTTCTADLDNGAACTGTGQCKSGFCVDGVCCDQACAGDCEACTTAKKGSGADGTCGNVAEGTDPRDRCVADTTPLSCAADGVCNGMGACRPYAKAGTPCGATACTAGSVSGKTCNGAGTCETAPKACAPFACGTDACKTTCANDTDCSADGYCNASKVCVTKQKNGAACADGRECEKGFCVDGVCCESACTAQCEACGESGTAGKCVPVSGAPRGKRASCAGDPAVCGGSCDGANTTSCTLAPVTKSCGSTCAAGKETASTCDGLGACAVGKPRDCSPFVCADDKTCASTCTTECAAGFKCAAGACVPAVGGTCNAEGTTSTATDGTVTPCGVYRCDPSAGTCLQLCTTSSDCAGGHTCDIANKICTTATPSSEEGGGGCGCETAPRGGRGSFAALLLLVPLGYARRRRRR